jgi:esterase/lipase superfamily enzyme
MKTVERWFSERVRHDMTLVRWGHWGRPVLVLPSAGGDAEEIERNGLIDACGRLLEEGRVKIYSVDSIAGQAMMLKWGSPQYRRWLLNAFHGYVRSEVIPAIRADLADEAAQVITAGASIGAFNAVALLCRYPDTFSAALGMSGTYRIEQFYEPPWTEDSYFASPLEFLPNLEGEQLDQLRQRFVILASGEGAWENIGESWHMASVLGAKAIPNRVDNWGRHYDHDWATWHEMLPHYLYELT